MHPLLAPRRLGVSRGRPQPVSTGAETKSECLPLEMRCPMENVKRTRQKICMNCVADLGAGRSVSLGDAAPPLASGDQSTGHGPHGCTAARDFVTLTVPASVIGSGELIALS